jgi:hypothetical protein
MSSEVIDNRDEQRFEMALGEETAFISYRKRGHVYILHHAEVPAVFEGLGHGSRLAQGALALVRAEGAKVVPRCSFVRAYLKQHPETNDLIAEDA